jgi:hypothetical protein
MREDEATALAAPARGAATPALARQDDAVRPRPGLARRGLAAATGAVGTVSGLAPHVLHHVGPLAGAALLAGAGGSALFGVLGLLLSVPFLLRLRRRFGNWKAPAAALLVFAVGFAVSTFVIGPAIRGGDPPSTPATERPATSPAPGHDAHH